MKKKKRGNNINYLHTTNTKNIINKIFKIKKKNLNFLAVKMMTNYP